MAIVQQQYASIKQIDKCLQLGMGFFTYTYFLFSLSFYSIKADEKNVLDYLFKNLALQKVSKRVELYEFENDA